MNIKIESDYDFKLIMEEVVKTIEFGSKEGADTDLLHILPPNDQMDSPIHNRDHFLFYKDKDSLTDHLFATPRMIVNSLLTGSSDLPYLLLIEGKFDGMLSFLYNEKHFMTYKTVKCLTGCAERDMKQSKGHNNPEKKLYWANKYYRMAIDIVTKHSDILRNEKLDECTVDNIRKVRKIAHQVVPSVIVTEEDMRYYEAWVGDQDLILNLRFARELYFKQWRDSL